ncbi:hypothetical protein [Streptomyces hygroscopicus]|uniref:hypothetical protein n=1 Tax=Streptomyces hygroscopicus TaxID=1912 RepID=UPI001FCAB7DB|nr:hypothetical protein [Streptomyces hygroscopicus]BDH16211.1 hypothetical protein HOK021_73900 [Streptomyces hygroscopicus]
MRISRRVVAFLGAATLAAGALTAVTAAPASAATKVSFEFNHYDPRDEILIYINGVGSSSVEFRNEGDKVCAWDGAGDGGYITGSISSGVTASTKGHNSPYNACNSKNVAEGKTLYLQACFKKAGFSYCSPRYKVWA